MMIQVICKDQKIIYSAYHLVKAFYPNEEVKSSISEGLESRILVTGDFYKEGLESGFREHQECRKVMSEEPLSEEGSEVKDGEKVERNVASIFKFRADEGSEHHAESVPKFPADDIPELYEKLQNCTGTELPWGMLTGVRPIKLATNWIGTHYAECMQEPASEVMEASFAEWFYQERKVSLEKAKMAFRIACREQQILRTIGARDLTSSGLVEWIPGYSLYIGIPFCPSICSYCSFSSGAIGKYQTKVQDYLNALEREMQERAAQNPGFPSTIYIGGGTPTSLSEAQLSWLMDRVDQIWNVQQGLTTGAIREYTVEAGRPDSITEEKLRILKGHHVTRISINPQTMQQKTLDRIGRRHTVEQILEAFQMARKMGFDNINMDLIMGLPEESNADVQDTLRQIRQLAPDSLTVHSLAIKRSSGMGMAQTKKRREQADFGMGMTQTEKRREQIDSGEKQERTAQSQEDTMCADVHADIGQMISDAGTMAAELGMAPYYLYRQKSIAGNFENIGYAKPGKEGIYNILIMEEVQSILACGAGASTKIVLEEGIPNPARQGQMTYMIRSENPKDIDTYIVQHQ